jgi:hypothetical protein
MFTSTGEFLIKWGSSGRGEMQFTGPMDLAFDRSGNLYIVDTYNNRIKKFGFTTVAAAPTSWGKMKGAYRPKSE